MSDLKPKAGETVREWANRLLPLSKLEPAVSFGVTTGYRFFGLWRISRAYTIDELASTFGVPVDVVAIQLLRLNGCQ